MTSTFQILKTLKDHLPEIRAMGVKDLWVYGSSAKGKPNPTDVDVLVEFDSPPGFHQFMDAKYAMELWLGLPVDLASRASCPERFMRRIASDLLHVA